MEEWQKKHKLIIEDFLAKLNLKKNEYVLKGGTALMECYGLDRFSEDIDLDGQSAYIIDIVQDYCEHNGFSFRIAKNTDTVKRCMIHYGGVKPLKVEVSCRRQEIPEEEITVINGIKVYTIDRLASMKASAYMSRDRIRDLYDVSFICNHYYDDLSETVKNMLRDAIQFKGLEQFDYLYETQKDELVEEEALANSFLNAIDHLGILIDQEEKEAIETTFQEQDLTM